MKKAQEFVEQIASLHASAREDALNAMREDINRAVDAIYTSLHVDKVSNYTGNYLYTNSCQFPPYFFGEMSIPAEIQEEVQSHGMEIVQLGNCEYYIRIPIY